MLPKEITERLNSGRSVAAELDAPEPDMRAFLMVIPRVRKHFNTISLKGWFVVDAQLLGRGETYDPAMRHDYEIRYLKHHAQYTETDWGWDYDCVLADPTTRVRRVFVERESDLEAELSPWLNDSSRLQATSNFDSSLVNTAVDVYLVRPDELPHLWLD